MRPQHGDQPVRIALPGAATLSDFPRVLFVTPAAFNRTTGGGITFGNLFAGWPKERLAAAHSDPIPTTSETCERYFRLGPAEIRRWGPLERIAPAAGGAASGGSSKAGGSGGFLRALKPVVFGNQLPDRGVLSSKLLAWIEEFQPQVLYSILGTNAMMEVVQAIQRRFALPLVVHMMDDWPESSYRGGLLGPRSRARMDRLLRELLEGASARLGICDAMCAAYEERYGVPFLPFQNTVDPAKWGALAKADLRAGSPADVVYVGSILPFAQLDSLVDCCHAAARLAGEGVALRLSIYSPKVYAEPFRERLVIGPNISLHDALTEDEAFFRRVAAADVLLLPVNFDAEAVRYLRYSMPTKVPAYLLSGTPILAYGPRDVAQIQYASDAGWAQVTSERGVEAVAGALRRLLEQAPLRAKLSSTARRTALERHDATIVRAAFQDVLRRAAG